MLHNIAYHSSNSKSFTAQLHSNITNMTLNDIIDFIDICQFTSNIAIANTAEAHQMHAKKLICDFEVYRSFKITLMQPEYTAITLLAS